ncbi:MAG: PilZ domain-containing protein [Thermodesulfobacteriota bacterium]|nr:PilZ domain-containing protein [Thermodesulfobacteriota bacterium]
MDESSERIDGDRMMEMLKGWIDSRRLCKMAIPDTDYAWITVILGIETRGPSPSLMVDKVKGTEKVISRYEKNGLHFEFLEKDGVSCWFKTRLIRSQPGTLQTELPESIFRMQRRRYVRIGARSGTEVLFQRNNGRMVSAKVRDYGLGGISFFTPPFFNLSMDELVGEIDLRIPNEKGWNRFHIPLARVKRLEKMSGGGGICVLEFVEIPETEKEQLWHYIFKEQRSLLRKTGKV